MACLYTRRKALRGVSNVHWSVQLTHKELERWTLLRGMRQDGMEGHG